MEKKDFIKYQIEVNRQRLDDGYKEECILQQKYKVFIDGIEIPPYVRVEYRHPKSTQGDNSMDNPGGAVFIHTMKVYADVQIGVYDHTRLQVKSLFFDGENYKIELL